jgi:hypothetical protein
MSRTLRIAMLAACPFPAPRGTPARIRRLAEALTARGHDVQVLAYHHGAGEALPYPVHRIPEIRHSIRCWHFRFVASSPTTRSISSTPTIMRACSRRRPPDPRCR